MKQRSTHPLTQLLTHSLTHSITHPLTSPSTHSTRLTNPTLYPLLGKPSITGLQSDPELAKQLHASPITVRIAFHAVSSLAVAHSILSSNFADLCTLDQVSRCLSS